jgi:hypothetical protein
MKFIISILSSVILMIWPLFTHPADQLIKDDNTNTKYRPEIVLYQRSSPPCVQEDYNVVVEVKNYGEEPFKILKQVLISQTIYVQDKTPSMRSEIHSIDENENFGILKLLIAVPKNSNGYTRHGTSKLEVETIKPGESLLLKVHIAPEYFDVPGKYKMRASLQLDDLNYVSSSICELECFKAPATQPSDSK